MHFGMDGSIRRLFYREKSYTKEDKMMGKRGLSLDELAFIRKVYNSCKTPEHRETYFEWEARLFRQAVKSSSYSALKIEKYLANRLRA
jgi:hypothetical protein